MGVNPTLPVAARTDTRWRDIFQKAQSKYVDAPSPSRPVQWAKNNSAVISDWLDGVQNLSGIKEVDEAASDVGGQLS